MLLWAWRTTSFFCLKTFDCSTFPRGWLFTFWAHLLILIFTIALPRTVFYSRHTKLPSLPLKFHAFLFPFTDLVVQIWNILISLLYLIGSCSFFNSQATLVIPASMHLKFYTQNSIIVLIILHCTYLPFSFLPPSLLSFLSFFFCLYKLIVGTFQVFLLPLDSVSFIKHGSGHIVHAQ